MKAGSQRASSKILSSVIILSLQTFVTPHVCADYQVRRNLGLGKRMDLSLFPKHTALYMYSYKRKLPKPSNILHQYSVMVH